MYNELSEYDQLMLAIEFHLHGTPIPQELVDLLGKDLIDDITNPITNKALSNDYTDTTSTTLI
jgi:hypothetical protein